MIRRTVFATDNESSRYALGGVLIELTRRPESRPWPPTAAAWPSRKARPSVGGHVIGRPHDDRPHPGDATDRAGPGRQRREVQIAARDNDVLVKSGRGDDLFAAGRGPVSQVARRLSAAGRDGPKIELTVGPFYAAVRQAAIVTSEEQPRRRFHVRRRQGGAWPATARSGRVARRVADRLRRAGDRSSRSIPATSAIFSRCSIPSRRSRWSCATPKAPPSARPRTATAT